MSGTAYLIISLFLIGCSSSKDDKLPYYNSPDFSPHFLAASEAEEIVTHRIGDFRMTDQQGKKITQKDIEGKVHIANFFFARCGTICPKMTNNLLAVQKKFGHDPNVVVLSYSVTPWQDSTQALLSFAERYGINSPRWHLLTGSTSEIYNLARQSYFAEQDLGLTKDSTEFLHTEHILLVDRTKRLRGIYNGTLALEVEQLIKDIEALLKE